MLYTESQTDLGHNKAVEIMELLTAAYPGHPWAVRVDGGVIFIRYLDVRLSGNWGMAMKEKDSNHDAAVLKREVIRMAGEWLERAGLARGRANGDEIVTVEGIPDRFVPKPVEVDAVVSDTEIRTEAHRDG
jgi:hypothetical protein